MALPSRRRPVAILAICCASVFMVGLDNTIVNLALPSIQRELHASVSGLQWIIDGYTIVIGSLLLFSGSMADRFGRRRVFQLGLLLFGIGSLLCGVAPTIGLLIALRTVQAVGGSMLNPVAMAIITTTFPERRDRARAIGAWGAVGGLSIAAGPVLGGILVAATGWRSIFWINVPVAIAALVLAAVFVPESRVTRPRRADPVGQLLVIVLLASVTYGIIEGRGLGTPTTLGSGAVAALALAVLVPYERRRVDPLVQLRFFRSIPFSGATLIALAGFGALAGFLFISTLYLQDVRGYSALHAGLLTLPMAGTMALFGWLSGRLLGARGARPPLVLAGAGIAAGAMLLTGISAGTPIPLLMAYYVVFGVGMGMLNPPITNTAVSGMPREQAGVAAAVASTSRQIGVALGVAVIGTVVTTGAHGSLAAGVAVASHAGWWIVAGCGVLVLALGVATTSRWARRTARRVADGIGPEPAADSPNEPTSANRTPR